MRLPFAESIERGRIRSGVMASDPGVPFGAFDLRTPSGDRLSVIASSGSDWEECGLEGEPWEHVSVRSSKGVPTWEQMCFVKALFFSADESVVQYHPRASAYVNRHPHVLHLWRPTKTAFPMPPALCV